jgi:hypothetical protein
MDKFFIILVVIMLIFILSIFFFVYFTSIGVEENVGELRTEFERAQVPRFSPMGIYVEFMKFLLSLFPK